MVGANGRDWSKVRISFRLLMLPWEATGWKYEYVINKQMKREFLYTNITAGYKKHSNHVVLDTYGLNQDTIL